MPLAVPGPTRCLDLLGGFALREGPAVLTLPPVAQRLLALLAVHGRPVSRAGLVATLWPDAQDGAGQASLRSTLWRLTRRGGDLVAGGSTSLQLAETVSVDYVGAVRSADLLIRRQTDPRLARLPGLVDDLLPHWQDDWVLVERERYRQKRLHAMEALSRQLTACGEYALAVEAGLAAVASEPLRESAHRVVIGAHLAEGNRGEALRQYASCRAVLRHELGVEPSPGLAALMWGSS